MNEINNLDDTINSRDIIARIEELEGEIEQIEEAADEADRDLTQDEEAAIEELQAELDTLQALAKQGQGCSGWKDGVTLIRDTYFEEWAKEYAFEIGALERPLEWPATCIDWADAANELQSDFTSVEFGGETYWVRS
jgi:hypothetical protein